MSLNTLQDLLVAQLKDIYSAEKQITHALPKMVKTAANKSLAEAFSSHLTETEGQIARLEEIFQYLGVSPRGKKCHGMEGLLSEGAETMEEEGEPPVIDAGLITDARRVEHYEIAAYNSTIAIADVLGEGNIVKLLNQNLEEEKAADEKLTELARTEVNRDAFTSAVAAQDN